MADDGSAQRANVWPLPKFYFKVESNALGEVVFQEVSGLDTENQEIEYRHDASPIFSKIKMPGLVKTGNVTLKNGIFAKDNQFFDWYQKIKMNVIEREDVTIKLLDETGAVTMIWVLSNAWPTKISGTDLHSDGSEVAVETLELAHEGINISNR
jgi:phage tail-like protein